MMWPFYLMALVAIVSTIRVVTNANPVHALDHRLCRCDHGLVRLRCHDVESWTRYG